MVKTNGVASKAKKAKAQTSKPTISIPALCIEQIQVKIVGISPLLVNCSKGLEQTLLDIQTGKPKTKKPKRDSQKEFETSQYYFADGKRTGFPSIGFKGSFVNGVRGIPGVTMVQAQQAIFVKSDDLETGLVEILGDDPILHQCVVTLPNGSKDVRFRAQYLNWSADLTIEFNSGMMNKEQICTAIEIAGFGVGIGEWRPGKSKTGTYGRFTMAK